MFFEYGNKEIEYLKAKDARLAKVIERVGHVNRVVDADLFSSVVHHIVGQQISTKAQQTIWERMNDALGEVTADALENTPVDKLQALGITFRKVQYIKEFSLKVTNRTFDLGAVENMNDEDAISALVSIKGVGVWTAEMILLFCLQRPNILSYDDLGILRGMRMVYHHRKVDRNRFEKYKRRLSPYCSVASLYFWAVSGGAIPEMKDYAPKKAKQNVVCGF